MPSVSVIISAYNHEKYITESINSVLNQQFQDFEIILIDNGSTDQTFKKIQQFTDSRIKVFRLKKNRGLCVALNYGVKKATGKYIALFSSDDVWLSDKLKKQVKILSSYPSISAVFSHAQIINEQNIFVNDSNNNYNQVFLQPNRTRHQWLNYFFYHGNCLCFPSAVIKKSIYDLIGVEDERLAQLHDFDLWIRLCLKSNIYIIQEKLLKFRIRGGNENMSADTQQTRIRSTFEFAYVLKHYLKIKNVKEFLNVFPESGEKYKDIVADDLIPFYVARQALKVPHIFHQKFALDILFELLNNKKLVNKLNKICNFTYNDLITLTGQHDLYQVGQIQNQEEEINRLKMEYKKLKYPLKNLCRK